MSPRFLTIEELLDRKGGRAAVLSAFAHLEDFETSLARAVEWAESRLLSLASPRYGRSLPTSPAETSEEIKGLVADLARMQLELAHTDQSSPNVLELGNRALAQLRDVARGVASLDLPALPADDVTPTVSTVRDLERPAMSGELVRRLPR